MVLSAAVADELAQRAHGQDVNRSGILFIDHVRRVASRFHGDPDEYAVPAALLHDVVEKGSLAISDLRAAGADERLIAIVDALTERDGEPEVEYLARCAADAVAARIKRADIEDKLQPDAGLALSPEARHALQTRAQQRLALLLQVKSTAR